MYKMQLSLFLSLCLSLSRSLGVKFLPAVSLLAELVTFAADAHLLGASCNLAPKFHDKGIRLGVQEEREWLHFKF